MEIRSKVTLIQSRSSDFSSLELFFRKNEQWKNNIASTANGGHIFLFFLSYMPGSWLSYFLLHFHFTVFPFFILFVTAFFFCSCYAFPFYTFGSFICIRFFLENIYLIKLCVSEAASVAASDTQYNWYFLSVVSFSKYHSYRHFYDFLFFYFCSVLNLMLFSVSPFSFSFSFLYFSS